MKMRFALNIDLSCLQVGTFSGRQNKNSTLLLRGVAIFARQKTFFNTLSVLRTFFMIFTQHPFCRRSKRLKYIFGPILVSNLVLCLALLACFLLCSFAFLYIIVLSHHLCGAEVST